MTAPAYASDITEVVPEPHRERPARAGEFCDFCPRRAFVIYPRPDGTRVGWCGWPEDGTEEDR